MKIPKIGAMWEEQGGFYAGRFQMDGDRYALILPPASTSRHGPIVWNVNEKQVAGAVSFIDGLTNTEAMAKSGSELAKWALDQGMYIPAVFELDMLYRAFKPTKAENFSHLYGANPSALPPAMPHTRAFPTKTALDAFEAGRAEAFETHWHWSSTQSAEHSGYAWNQSFTAGIQYPNHKSFKAYAVAVRRMLIEDATTLKVTG